MTIATEIARIEGLRNDLRDKLVALELVESAANLQNCVEAVEGIVDNGGVTTAITTKGQSVPIPQGYHNGAGSVAIASAELAKIIPSNIKEGVSILGVQGEHGVDAILPDLTTPASNADVLNGKEYVDGSGVKQTGSMPKHDVTDLDIGISEVTTTKPVIGTTQDISVAVEIEAGYYPLGITMVDIFSAPIVNEITPNTSFTEGNYYYFPNATVVEGIDLQSKTVTPTTSKQTVTPDSGKYGLSSVVVNAIPSNYKDISIVTAGASNVLAGKVFVASDGKTTTGTMVNRGAINASIDGLDTMSYTIPQGYHSGTGKVTLTDDIEARLAAI